MRSKVLLIKRNPKISAVRYDQVRTTILDVFPYMIHYTVNEQTRVLLLLRYFILPLILKGGQQEDNAHQLLTIQ